MFRHRVRSTDKFHALGEDGKGTGRRLKGRRKTGKKNVCSTQPFNFFLSLSLLPLVSKQEEKRVKSLPKQEMSDASSPSNICIHSQQEMCFVEQFFLLPPQMSRAWIVLVIKRRENCRSWFCCSSNERHASRWWRKPVQVIPVYGTAQTDADVGPSQNITIASSLSGHLLRVLWKREAQIDSEQS